MATKKKPNINHWLQTFGTPGGYRVLKEIKSYAKFEGETESIQVRHGRQQVFDYILERLKASSGKKEIYAGIIYEMELL